MTITQQIDYIMGHPFMAVAMKDEAAMRKLLFEVQFHVYRTVSLNGAKAFRKYRDMNDPIIYEEIRDQEPPENMDIRLPIPMIEEVVEVKECPVITMQVLPVVVADNAVKKTRVRLLPNPFQMIIEFPSRNAVTVVAADLMEG